MLPFLHDRLQRQQALLTQSGTVLDKFHRQDLDLAESTDALLADTLSTWHTLGLALPENEARAWRAELSAARQGVDPATGQRISQHRRELQRGTALRVLLGHAERLRADIARDQDALDDGRRSLQPMVLVAIQQGLWPPEPPAVVNQAALEALWRAMLGNATLGTAGRQLAMTLGAADVLLLLEDLTASAFGIIQP